MTLSMTVLASLRGGHVCNLQTQVVTETEGEYSGCSKT